MSDRRCPYVGGLAICPNHPKWHVIGHSHHYWFAYAPCADVPAADFHSWQEAFDYAHTRAAEEAAILEIVEEA